MSYDNTAYELVRADATAGADHKQDVIDYTSLTSADILAARGAKQTGGSCTIPELLDPRSSDTSVPIAWGHPVWGDPRCDTVSIPLEFALAPGDRSPLVDWATSHTATDSIYSPFPLKTTTTSKRVHELLQAQAGPDAVANDAWYDFIPVSINVTHVSSQHCPLSFSVNISSTTPSQMKLNGSNNTVNRSHDQIETRRLLPEVGIPADAKMNGMTGLRIESEHTDVTTRPLWSATDPRLGEPWFRTWAAVDFLRILSENKHYSQQKHYPPGKRVLYVGSPDATVTDNPLAFAALRDPYGSKILDAQTPYDMQSSGDLHLIADANTLHSSCTSMERYANAHGHAIAIHTLALELTPDWGWGVALNELRAWEKRNPPAMSSQPKIRVRLLFEGVVRKKSPALDLHRQ
jgi:hypothetical protein